MKKVFCLITCFLVIFCFASISVAQQTKAKKETSPKQKVKDTPYAGEVSVMGITLGKSLNELNIKECPKNKLDNYVYDFEVDKVCYKFSGNVKIVGIDLITYKQIDIPTQTKIFFAEDKNEGYPNDILDKPIMYIIVSTDFDNDKRFKEIVIEKFGKPKSVATKSEKYPSGNIEVKIIDTWNKTKEGHSIEYEKGVHTSSGGQARLRLKHRLFRSEEDKEAEQKGKIKEKTRQRF